jgi:hypothetical protein
VLIAAASLAALLLLQIVALLRAYTYTELGNKEKAAECNI